MGKEGLLSMAVHVGLAGVTSLLVLHDPLGLGAMTVLTFALSQCCISALKHTTKALALAARQSGPGALWRRPPGSGRPAGSPGFPSAHTGNCAAICVFIACSLGVHPVWASIPTLLMAVGRLADRNHTLAQTIAGVAIGPWLGFAAQYAAQWMLSRERNAEGLPLWWNPLAVAALSGGFFHLLKTVKSEWR